MKTRICMLAILMLFLFQCACTSGKPGGEAPDETMEQPSTTDWRSMGFAVPGDLEEGNPLWAGQYLPWEHKDQTTAGEEPIYVDSGAWGQLLWYLGTERGFDGTFVFGPEGNYFLETYDAVTGEREVKRFTPGELGLDGEFGFFTEMDLIDAGHYALRWLEYKRDEEGAYCQTADIMVWTDLAGDVRTADFWDTYLERRILKERSTELPLVQGVNWRCDGKGNVCVMQGYGSCCLFDRSGKAVLEYEGSQRRQLAEPFLTPDGELILPVYDESERGYEFLWVDAEGGEFRSLGRMEASVPCLAQIYGMLGDEVFYRWQDGTRGDVIVSWNVGNGRRKQVFDLRGAGIGTGYGITMALREGQPPVLWLTRFKDGLRREWLTALMEQKPADDGTVRVADLTSSDSGAGRVAECAVLASMEMPSFRYEYEDAHAQEDRDRIMAELSQGKGPDLLFVSVEDAQMLAEKGLLMEMEDLIPREIQEELLPGVLEIGTLDGRLLGVPAGVAAQTLVVSGNVWQRDTWRLEDVISLMEEGKLTGAIRSPYLMSGYLSPALTVAELVYYSLKDSFLIDWENRKSHFDDERFIRLLELTGTDLSGVSPNEEVWLNEGRDVLFGWFANTGSFLDFFAHMETEGGRIVGYPTAGAHGSYLEAEGGILVVNARVAQKEAVTGFLELLLGEELQSKENLPFCMSVRKLDLEKYIEWDEAGKPLYRSRRTVIPLFPDGTTALHRAKEFLEGCVAAPPTYGQIDKIINEELNAMYAENKSPRTTAEIINNRVQLYLNEGN